MSKDYIIEHNKNSFYLAYKKESGISISESSTEDEKSEFVRWVNKKCLEDHRLYDLFIEQVSVLVPRLSTDISSKIAMMAQYHCPMCKNDGYPTIILPIRLSPESKQVLSKTPKKRKAFELAIKDGVRNSKDQFANGDKLCIHVVFALGKMGRDKDIDNMSKALLDGLKGDLFGDDIDIVHLSSMKINQKHSNSYIYINARRSNIDEINNVLVDGMYSKFAVKELILDEYMANV